MKCGHLYQNPMPEASDLLQRYDDDYKEYEIENGFNFFTLMRYGLRDAGFFSWEQSLPQSRRALDIGCATGVLVAYLRDRGWDAEGLEVCVPAAEYGIRERGVPIHIGTLETFGPRNGSFDLVHFSHVIEHIHEINSFLEQVRMLCRPGGRVVITTPNRASLQAWLMGAHWRSAIADHTHLFTAGELKRLLRRHGFEPIRQKTWGGIPLGMAGSGLKRLVDRAARLTGLGDVVMVSARRTS